MKGRCVRMVVSYNKLWKLLIDKKMKRIDLMEATGIGTSTLSKLGKDQYVSMEVLVKICKVLNCNIGDIVDVVKTEVPHEKID